MLKQISANYAIRKGFDRLKSGIKVDIGLLLTFQISFSWKKLAYISIEIFSVNCIQEYVNIN